MKHLLSRLVSLRPHQSPGFLTSLAAATAITYLMLAGSATSVKAALQDSPKMVLDEAWQIVNREYVDESFNKNDWVAIRQNLLNRDYANREQAYNALRSVLKRLEDPYTRFMDPKQFDVLNSQTSGELSGVGIRLDVDEKTKTLVVVEPLPNSPAMKAGVKAGDRILAINGRSAKGMSVEQASGMIRGQEGTVVKLRIDRPSMGEFDLPLTRARIELQAVRSFLKTEGKRRVGYIRLSEFSSHAADQTRQAIRGLLKENVDSFVLDLRGNPGGLLQASIEISRMWVDQGSIVRTVDRKGGSEEINANRTALTNLPLIVLVDKNSASSSEILTGALKDNRRATIVGSQTFGKALVQSVHPLSDGSGIAVTIAHYYTPNGTDISQKGIEPNIVLNLTPEQQQKLYSNPRLFGTLEDPQYVRALAALEQVANANNGNVGQNPTFDYRVPQPLPQ
ncbi:MAG: S41 family peptidase [Synechococcales bacterium]|nr:S41 family peptidase [Synechococcales bacterium]